MKDKRAYKDMWVFIQHQGEKAEPVSLELCCEARKLCDAAGEALAAVVVGALPQGELDKVLSCGVDKLIFAEGTGYDSLDVDAYAHLFTVLCQRYEPSAVLVGGTIFGRDFAPRFACRLSTGCTSDATELVYDPKTGDIEFVEPAVGGKLMAVITLPVKRPQVGTIRPGTFKYAPMGQRPCTVIRERVDFPLEKLRTKILSFQPEEGDESLDIAGAEVIVCVGNGLKGADSLPKYRALAEKLGGKLACTRPVSDRGLLPYKLVVGQSGVVVKPKVYLAFGVSGAINHVTGFSDSGLVIAINSDPDAPIFNYCHYGLVADMDETCQALLDKLRDISP